ncbi:putative MscS family protein.1 precursor [Roseovarius gaetbuli]|uniref:Putative MscS family protein.1 n=1 Tax=Roseovarius gaetbuli TaxID=1356575 RepID=A0A1X6YCJ0_9RHOB|nr:DUF3772 domain-containing protein [Roseovarius gaetbuli]SLN17383.1 putative MscS family protein.1 precursor [Roseovarius gaetbuli]
MRQLLRSFCLILALCLANLPLTGVGQMAHAQQTIEGPDYAAWEDTATRVENAIESGGVSTAVLEDLRRELTQWREQFVNALGANSTTIKTVQDQLDAIGPPPETGAEVEDISAQRDELNRRLARLQAPIRTAELARSRADGLIQGIDEIIRNRQTAELLRLGPSPMNPLHWSEGVKVLYELAETVQREVTGDWESPVGRTVFNDNLPVVLAWLLAGLVLIARGRRWSRRLMRHLTKEEMSAGRWMATFLISLGEWLLPYAGVYALVKAFSATALFGTRGTLILDTILPAAFIFLLARWLALQIFPRNEKRVPLLNLDDKCRYSGRLYGASMGLVIAAFYFLRTIAEQSSWSEEATNVVLFPVLVLAGLLLFRLAKLLLMHSRAAGGDSDAEETFRDRLAQLLARALMLLAILAPVLAAVGYLMAAQAMMLPALLSLMLSAALLVLQRVVTEVYVMLSGNREGADDALMPVLAGFVLVILSLPLFALIWGARPAQLTEIWVRFTEGVTVGGTTISPSIFLTLAVVFMLGYVLTRLVQGTLKNTVLPKTKLDAGGRNAIVSGVGYVGIFLAALVSITSAGIDLSSLAIVAGALSVGIGFGLQNIVSNFVSGIILLIERPISEGDWIEVGGKHGYVRSISVRSTRIETFDRTDVIVPNADFVSGTVTNYTRGNTVGRVIVPVGVAYGSDTRQIETILREIAEAHPMVLAVPPPNVVFRGFGASSLDFEIRAILRDVNWVMSVHSDMNHEIARRFVEEGIEIPFPQQDVWFRNGESLSGKPAPAQEAPPSDATPPPSSAPVQKTEADYDAEGGDGDGR